MQADRIEAKWIDAFCEVFERCAVKAGDTAAILSETQSRALNVHIAELALLLEMQRPATAVGVSDSSVLRISRSMFQRVLEGHPDAARRLRDDLASRTSQAASDLLIASAKLTR